MEKFDWKETIKINIYSLRAMGLWPDGDDTYKLNWYLLYSFIVLVCFEGGHNFFQTINIYFIIDDLEQVTAVIFVAFIQFISIIKSYYVILNMKTLKKLMIKINSDLFQPKNERQRKLIQPDLTFWKRTYVVFWMPGLLTFFFWATFPILDKSVKEFRLPFIAWYPFNTKKSPIYQIIYIYQLMGAYVIGIVSITVDMLIAALNMYVGLQCDILCDDLRHFNYDCDTTPANVISQQIITYIQHHREIVSFAEDSNKFFNWIVLTQFFTSGVSIGITMFQLTMVAPFSSEFYSLLFYGAVISVEIFVYCWFGNEVEIKSTQIPYAAFESNWMDASHEVKKYLIFFVLRSQTPIKMSALNLFYLTVDTFVRIMRSAWSYFAILRQVNEPV